MAKGLDDALRAAYRLLGYRQRSERELRERLGAKGFPCGPIEDAIARLKEQGYLNDASYALSLVREAGEIKCLGREGARRYLLAKGIPRETAEEALSGYDERAAAARFREKKLHSLRGHEPDVVSRRLAGALLRRGHAYDTIRKTLKDKG